MGAAPNLLQRLVLLVEMADRGEEELVCTEAQALLAAFLLEIRLMVLLLQEEMLVEKGRTKAATRAAAEAGEQVQLVGMLFLTAGAATVERGYKVV